MKKRSLANFLNVSLVLLAGFMIFVPGVLQACPLCVNATPYKDGLLWAVGLLIPVPFVLSYLMYGWFQRAS